MEFSKDRKEALLSAKATGHLIPELQTMTDEEFLNFIESRTEATQHELDGKLYLREHGKP